MVRDFIQRSTFNFEDKTKESAAMSHFFYASKEGAMETICAISTALSQGAISLIRISGDKAIEIADKIFRSFSGRKASEMEGHTCLYGKIYDKEQSVDDVLLTVFRAPSSYTGEDTVEISCHGGVFVTKKVLELVIRAGATQALAGEFTKRAFVNGKLDLTQAEAVMDIISSEGERALGSANRMRDGAVYKKITSVRQELISLLSSLAAWADYPEEDLPDVEQERLKATIGKANDELLALIKSYDDGLVFKEGVETAIVGSPNVGKSSLMNYLLGFDRSIVTDIEGTTRDVIEETARIGDITLKLCDTAGIRTTDDVVESIGVKRAKEKLEGARIVLAVFDASCSLCDEDKELLSELNPQNTLVILNKTDLERKLNQSDFSGFKAVEVSVTEQTGLDKLKEEILNLIGVTTASNEEVFASLRQKECAQRASSLLGSALKAAEEGETPDAVTVLLDEALSSLLELTGERATDTVVDEVFSRFCVGK